MPAGLDDESREWLRSLRAERDAGVALAAADATAMEVLRRLDDRGGDSSFTTWALRARVEGEPSA